MITYRSHVHTLAAAASAEASGLALSIVDCVARRGDKDYKEYVQEVLPRLMDGAESLQQSVDTFTAALPLEVKTYSDNGLSRHMHWIKRRLREGIPAACSSDPIDIARNDIPAMLKRFEGWYQQRVTVDGEVEQRIRPLMEAGQLNAAAREAWAIFKTRMVKRFELSKDLDGQPLVQALFGTKGGATAELLSNKEMEAYSNLFKGLYALYRNPVAHNDLPSNPEETEAVIVMINLAIVKIEHG